MINFETLWDKEVVFNEREMTIEEIKDIVLDSLVGTDIIKDLDL